MCAARFDQPRLLHLQVSSPFPPKVTADHLPSLRGHSHHAQRGLRPRHLQSANVRLSTSMAGTRLRPRPRLVPRMHRVSLLSILCSDEHRMALPHPGHHVVHDHRLRGPTVCSTSLDTPSCRHKRSEQHARTTTTWLTPFMTIVPGEETRYPPVR